MNDIGLLNNNSQKFTETRSITIQDKVVKQIADNSISPVLIPFVWWVLKKTQERQIKRLYFLARDGYIMYKIALQFCVKFDLNIECRYLYSSRIAWRTAAYQLIGEEKYKYIFDGGYLITPRIILKRTQADKMQRYKIYQDIIHKDMFDENKPLSDKEVKEFAEKLKKSEVFNNYLHNISQKQFHDVSAYLSQEGLFNGNEIAIVDSGWTGSIQRTLRQIVERHIENPKITGFYFGLYTDSGDDKDGDYIAWYFSKSSPIGLMTKFNNNVFECMCATPYDTTIGYSSINDIYIPLFQPNSNSAYNIEVSKRKNYHIENYAAKFINSIKFDEYNDSYLGKSRKILQRFMTRPSKEEIDIFGRFTFCDDASNAYDNTLVTLINKKYIKNYTFFKRLYNKLKNKNISNSVQPDLFWFHGSVAATDIRAKNWYLFNYWAWETLRLRLKNHLNILRHRIERNVSWSR